MIPIGVMASQDTGGGGGGSLPVGATSQLDFVNAFYYAGGSAQSISTLLGGSFDAGAISASGMRITPSNGNKPKAIGGWLSDLLAGIAAGCTIVYDVTSANDPGGFMFFPSNTGNVDTASQVIKVYAEGGMQDYDSLSLFPSAITGAGAHKMAFTLNRDIGGGDREYAWSDDGAAAITQTVTYTPSGLISEVLIGHDGVGIGNSLNDIYIRSITLYPAKLPADLPALTA